MTKEQLTEKFRRGFKREIDSEHLAFERTVFATVAADIIWPLMVASKRLAELKEHKETYGKTSEYELQKPGSWAGLFGALADLEDSK